MFKKKKDSQIDLQVNIISIKNLAGILAEINKLV